MVDNDQFNIFTSSRNMGKNIHMFKKTSRPQHINLKKLMTSGDMCRYYYSRLFVGHNQNKLFD
jgi:hypothetical protein